MMLFYKTIFIVALTGFIFVSCTVSKSFPKKYYKVHQKSLDTLQEIYKEITKEKSIAVAFSDWHFKALSLELKSNSIRYIYDFKYGEPRIKDTLEKYGYSSKHVLWLIERMKNIECTWINNLDYYVDKKRSTLLFMGVNAKRLIFSLKSKYYLFNFYAQPQYYDENGKLLDKKKLNRLRKINNETFYRITDKVCYTISGKFR